MGGFCVILCLAFWIILVQIPPGSLYTMKGWLFWAGVGFIIGGLVSYALNYGVSGTVRLTEDISGYAIGWMGAGAVLLAVGLIKK